LVEVFVVWFWASRLAAHFGLSFHRIWLVNGF